MSEPQIPEGPMPPINDVPNEPMPDIDSPDDNVDEPEMEPNGSENQEIDDIFDKLDTEKQAAVIKYAKSMINDTESNEDDEDGMDAMPMENHRHVGNIVNEIVNNILDNMTHDVEDRRNNKIRNKKVTSDNPYISKR